MAGCNFPELGYDLRALVGGDGAAGMEHAAAGGVQRAGHFPGQQYPLTLGVYNRIWDGDSGKQRLSIGMQRVDIDLVAVGDLHYFA